MTARATGHYARRDDGLYLQFDRLFHSPIEEVWYTLTNPNALRSWFGTYTGSPAAGAIRVQVTAEADATRSTAEAPWQEASVLECRAPSRFHLDVGQPDDTTWRLFCHLREAGGMTTLTFGHRVDQGADVGSIGPGWDWYLDRLVAVRAGRPMPDWNDYFPALAQFYRELHVPQPAAK